MAQDASNDVIPPEKKRRRFRPPRSLVSLGRYTLTRGFALIVVVAVGVYLTVMIANMGGYVDEIRKGEIREKVGMEVRANKDLQRKPPSVIRQYIDERVAMEEKRLGLDKPFLSRSFAYLGNALSLNLGRAERITSNSGSSEVRLIILERLPNSLALFGSASVLVFLLAVFTALFLSRRYGSILDRSIIALAPLSAAPPWFYGIFLILIFAGILGILPYGGMLDAPPPATALGYVLSVMKHMVLPLLAWLISGAFIAIYTWRTFFLIHSSEDYVELAKAKGLGPRMLERRYVLRPALPTVITNFALMMIAAWQGAIITETIFSWPGLGRMYYNAIGQFDTPVIIGLTVIYAYLLALTVFSLDIIYALIDPRVKLGAEGSQ